MFPVSSFCVFFASVCSPDLYLTVFPSTDFITLHYPPRSRRFHSLISLCPSVNSSLFIVFVYVVVLCVSSASVCSPDLYLIGSPSPRISLRFITCHRLLCFCSPVAPSPSTNISPPSFPRSLSIEFLCLDDFPCHEIFRCNIITFRRISFFFLSGSVSLLIYGRLSWSVHLPNVIL